MVNNVSCRYEGDYQDATNDIRLPEGLENVGRDKSLTAVPSVSILQN